MTEMTTENAVAIETPKRYYPTIDIPMNESTIKAYILHIYGATEDFVEWMLTNHWYDISEYARTHENEIREFILDGGLKK